MSYFEAYCNTTTDLKAVSPDINNYDRKSLIENWVTHSGSIYKANNSGYVEVLFRSGEDLGSPQSALLDVDSDGEWYYDSDADVTYIYSDNDVKNLVMEGGSDWSSLRTNVVNENAEKIRSYLGRPILKTRNSSLRGKGGHSFPFVVVKSNAILSCADLIRPFDFDKAQQLEEMAISPQGTGLLDRVKRGDYSLDSDTTNETSGGVVREISINSNTTGGIVDITNATHTNTQFDNVRVVISTAGTLAPGTSSPVKYDVWVGDDTGIKMNRILQDEVITGGFQSSAYGIKIRFAAEGVYTLNDEWGILVMGGAKNEVGVIKSGQVVR